MKYIENWIGWLNVEYTIYNWLVWFYWRVDNWLVWSMTTYLTLDRFVLPSCIILEIGWLYGSIVYWELDMLVLQSCSVFG